MQATDRNTLVPQDRAPAGPVPLSAELLVHVAGGLPKGGWQVAPLSGPTLQAAESGAECLPKGGW